MERGRTEVWDEMKIPYPVNIKENEKKRKTFKNKHLLLNPEHLYADATIKGDWMTNLIFFTSRPKVWQESICRTYDVPRDKLRVINHGSQVTILNDTGSTFLNINIYDTGTVVINGDDPNLREFKSTFFELKTKMEESDHMPKSEESDEEEKVEVKEEKNPPAQPDPATDLDMGSLKL